MIDIFSMNLRRVFLWWILCDGAIAQKIIKSYFLDQLSFSKAPQYSSFIPQKVQKRSIEGQNLSANTTGFVINLSCDAAYGDLNPNESCKIVLDSIIRAANTLSTHLALRERIRVSVNYYSFCSSSSGALGTPCDEHTKVLGRGSPEIMQIISKNAAKEYGLDANYGYPAAVARQYFPDEMQDVASDIRASFNSDYNWYFGNGDPNWGETIVIKGGFYNQSDKVSFDFEQVVIHELVHGLGFVSSWGKWYNDEFFLPSYLNEDKNSGFVELLPPWIFCKYLSDANTRRWLSTYGNYISGAISDSVRRGQSDWYSVFKTSTAYNVSVALASENGLFSSPQSLLIWHPSRKQDKFEFAVLNTPREYVFGSSISHLDDKIYFGTSEFLMRPNAILGESFNNFVPSTTRLKISKPVIGILRAIGYIVYQ